MDGESSNDHDLPSPAHQQTYADAVYAKGAALENCFGFVDGTVRPIARPDENERVVYNGHKRVSVAVPNGLAVIANMFCLISNREGLGTSL